MEKRRKYFTSFRKLEIELLPKFMKMSDLINNLPDDLNDLLSKKAKEMGVAKTEIVVRALRTYLHMLDHIKERQTIGIC